METEIESVITEGRKFILIDDLLKHMEKKQSPSPLDAADDWDDLKKLLDKINKLGMFDPNFGDLKECKCGHHYERHFDSYDNMHPVGCKYCPCFTFKEQNEN